jgi:hypothetical protein
MKAGKTTKKRLPKPPVPGDLNLRTLPFMPLFIEKLKKSRAWAWARSTPLLGYVYINLWSAAWNEIPACSLPNDEDLLAERAGVDLKTWRKLGGKALYKFTLHADNRLYHPELVEHAQKVLASRQKDAAKHRRSRGGSREENQDVGGMSRHGHPARPTGQGGGQAGETALNLEHRTKSKEDEGAGAPSRHSRKTNDDGGKEGGPEFRRHMGESRTMAETLGKVRDGAPVRVPIPAGAVRTGDNRAALADRRMVDALQQHDGLTLDQAWQTVMAARDPSDVRHRVCREQCEARSQANRLGWYAAAEAPA